MNPVFLALIARDLNDLAVGTGLRESVDAAISTYPNPASTTLTVDLGTLLGRTELSVIDASGRVLLNTVATLDRTQLDVSDLSNGVYLLTARQGGQVWSTRVAVQH